jgi:signal transduction histidine kinase
MTSPPVVRGRILVVDDTDAGRYGKSRTLRQAGFEVLEAATGADGLHLVTTQAPDLVVLDIQLPDISGWDVCKRIKSGGAGAPLVLQVSATYVQESDTVKALEGGADACLTEPIDPAVLLATVRALLRLRLAEEALRQALTREQGLRQVAESANRAKDEFLATLSHELRSPLGTILTWVSLLKEGGLDGARADQGLAAIERSTQLQVKLIADLLDISSIILGKTKLDVGSVNLGTIAQAAVEGIRAAAEAKHVTVSVHVDPALPRIAGDPMRLQQVVENLCSNALKFTPGGGTIAVQVRRAGNVAEIEVADNGKGVALEFLPFIFERFRQADASTTRREGGLGLGLAIVRHLVEMHYGTVEARSQGVGLGMTVIVRLPVALPPEAAVVVGDEGVAATAPGAGASLAGLRILIVDDEHDARDALGTALARRGAETMTAATVDAAMEMFDAVIPDVLVGDIAMPGEDGYSLIRRLRARPEAAGGRVPAVALTAYGRLSDRQRILAAGYDECLTKPIEIDELAVALQRATHPVH